MQRRDFIRDSGLAVISLGVFGSVTWGQGRFVGSSPTATDILGPFYRPNAPFRKNLNPRDFRGKVLHLSGTILKDGKTRMKDCLVEIWQCEEDGFYDNLSDDYRYRASQRTGKNGEYRFVTVMPVPEPTDETRKVYRPPHIHLRISAKDQQDLITQIYFAGAQYLETDPSTRSGAATNRVLELKKIDDRNDEIRFDIALRNEYVPEDAVFQKLSGVYKMSDGSMMEFFRDGDLLFYKTNNQIWGALAYQGNNTFGGKEDHTEARFEVLPRGSAKVWFRFSRRRETRLEGKKVLNYQS